VLSMQRNTVVVLHTPGAVLMPWVANASAIVAAFVPGQADGAAITVRTPNDKHLSMPRIPSPMIPSLMTSVHS
jgi:hypothetical protein